MSHELNSLPAYLPSAYVPAVDCIKPAEKVAITPSGFAPVRPSLRSLITSGAQALRVGEFDFVVFTGAGGSVVFSDRQDCDTSQTVVKNASTGNVTVSPAGGLTIDNVVAAVITLFPRVAIGPALNVSDLGESVDIIKGAGTNLYAH